MMFVVPYQSVARDAGWYKQQENMLSVLNSVGSRGLILLNPDCSLLLEGIDIIMGSLLMVH